ncbi:MAG: hypothetical protein AAF531_15085 [Actinomycetota bacterium]
MRATTSTGSNHTATVVIDDGPPMKASVRVAAPGVLSMSFRLGGPGNEQALGTHADGRPPGVRLVGDLATVTVEPTKAQVLTEIVSVSVMGYVEVCEATILRQISGPPIERRTERRKATRYRFAEVVSVNINPIGTFRYASAQLGDLSTGGCGLELPTASYQKIGGLVEATLSFELPGMSGSVALSAKRRNTRGAEGGAVWMGMIWSREQEEAATLKQVAAYLAKRWGGRSPS